MEKRKLRRGTRDKEEKGRGREMPARSFLFFHSSPLSSSRISVRQNRSATPPPRLWNQNLSLLRGLLFSQPMKAITLCWFPSCVTIYRFPLDGFFPFSFPSPRFSISIVTDSSSFFSSTCNSCCNSMRQQKMRDNLNDFERK